MNFALIIILISLFISLLAIIFFIRKYNCQHSNKCVHQKQVQELKKHVQDLKAHINMRRSTEDELKQAKERAELYFKITPSAIFTVNADFIITSWNDRAADLTGYTSHEIVGKPCSIISNILCDDLCTLKTKNPSPILNKQTTISKKNGEQLIIVKNINCLKNSSGKLIGVIESFIDVTEQISAQTELVKFEQAVTQSPSMVVMTDAQGLIEYVNPKFSQVTGYTPDEVCGQNPRLLKSGAQPTQFYKDLWETITSGNEWRGNFQNKKKNGELYWEFASISPIRNIHNQTTHFVAIKEDITERKENEDIIKKTKEELEIQTWGLKKTNDFIKILYEELKTKNDKLLILDKLKSDFVSTVSHELRTPLTVIREGVSQVVDGILGETTDEQKEFLLMTLSNIDRLSRMINDLLDISKIESGKILLQKNQCNIVQIARDVYSSFYKRVKDHELDFVLTLPKNDISIYADQDKIIQVFTNLIGNALKFTKQGSITLALVDTPEHIACSVIDTGVGIDKKNQPKLFNKFQQFGRKEGPGEKGTGLGLSIAKGIIDLHKGHIWVTSEIGEGTTFTFTIPKK